MAHAEPDVRQVKCVAMASVPRHVVRLRCATAQTQVPMREPPIVRTHKRTTPTAALAEPVALLESNVSTEIALAQAVLPMHAAQERWRFALISKQTPFIVATAQRNVALAKSAPMASVGPLAELDSACVELRQHARM